jgi:thiamine transport system ATP-binding protein
MRAGRIEAVAAPRELWLRPPTEFVARFLGLNNIVDAQVTAGRAATALGTFDIGRTSAGAEDGPFRLLIRPDALRLDPGGPLAATVVSSTFRGDHTLVRVVTKGKPTPLTLEFQLGEGPVPDIGDEVRLAADAAGLVLLPLT